MQCKKQYPTTITSDLCEFMCHISVNMIIPKFVYLSMKEELKKQKDSVYKSNSL